MTLSDKQRLITAEKAQCFDRISALLLILDSHRNFHRRVDEDVKKTLSIISGINRQRETTSPQSQFRCQCADPGCIGRHGVHCNNDAAMQVFRVDMNDEAGTPMCETCASDAMNSGVCTIAEEEVIEPEDLLKVTMLRKAKEIKSCPIFGQDKFFG